MIWSRQGKGALESSLINDCFHVDVILREKKIGEFASLSLSGIKISRVCSSDVSRVQAPEVRNYLSSYVGNMIQ